MGEKMFRKVVGIFITLMLLIMFNSMAEKNVSDKGNMLMDEVDQEQTIDNYGAYVWHYFVWAQSFVPSLEILTRIEIKIQKIGNPSSNLEISIRSDLYGEDLAWMSFPPNVVPSAKIWLEVNFEDIKVNPGNTYFIVCYTSGGDALDYYDWRNSYDEDTYPKGDAWVYGYEGKEYWFKFTPPFDFCFRTYGRENQAPAKPSTPAGPPVGKAGVAYTYSTFSQDPDGDRIKYGWDWNNDGIVDEWTILYNSGEMVSTPHSWSSAGIYAIKVKAQDEHGAESEWSDPMYIIMPKCLMMELLFRIINHMML